MIFLVWREQKRTKQLALQQKTASWELGDPGDETADVDWRLRCRNLVPSFPPAVPLRPSSAQGLGFSLLPALFAYLSPP